jgi:hypothetical protein
MEYAIVWLPGNQCLFITYFKFFGTAMHSQLSPFLHFGRLQRMRELTLLWFLRMQGYDHVLPRCMLSAALNK